MKNSADRGEQTYLAWLVDLDGTLYHQGAIHFVMGLELALGGWSAIACIQAFREQHERLRLEVSEPVSDPFLSQISRTAAELDRTDDEVRRIVEQWMIARPSRWLRVFRRRSLLTEITDFRKRGGRTALVSDYPAQLKLEAMGIAHLFDVVIAGGECSKLTRLKPWPDGYLLAAERLCVSPTACLVIGDRPDIDGLSAQQAAMAFRCI